MNIAIVDDEQAERTLLKKYFSKYSSENGGNFAIDEYDDAVSFLDKGSTKYDIVFMDIKMPNLDGMSAAKRFREKDCVTELVFVTNVASYAVKGYSVDAADFIVKPITYFGLKKTLDKLIKRIERKSNVITIRTSGGINRVAVDSIFYIECNGHEITYHTDQGEISLWASLKSQEEFLPSDCFARLNKYCLINMKYIKEIRNNEVSTVNGAVFAIGRSKKEQFMSKVLDYYRNNA